MPTWFPRALRDWFGLPFGHFWSSGLAGSLAYFGTRRIYQAMFSGLKYPGWVGRLMSLGPWLALVVGSSLTHCFVDGLL